MDINTQRFLFASSGSNTGSLWINVTSVLSSQGPDDAFSTYGPLTINEKQKEIVVGFASYQAAGPTTNAQLYSWDLDGNFVKFTHNLATNVPTGLNSRGLYYVDTPIGTPVNVGNAIFTASNIPNMYLAEVTYPGQEFDPVEKYILYNFDLGGSFQNIFISDVVFGTKTNSTESGAFFTGTSNGYPFALHLDYGPSGIVPASTYTSWRSAQWVQSTGIGTYANYSKQIQVFGQSSPDDYFITSIDGTDDGSQPVKAYYSYYKAFPGGGISPLITFKVENGYGIQNDIFSPHVLDQDNSKYLYGMFSSYEPPASNVIQNVVCFKYDVDGLGTTALQGFKPTSSTGSNAGFTTNGSESGLMDLEEEDIANLSLVMFDNAATNGNYNIVLARVNVATGQIFYCKKISTYSPTTGQENTTNLVGSRLKYNEFGNLVIAGGCKLPISESSSFCMTYDPVTGPVNGLYSNQTTAFRITDYAMTNSVGDVYSITVFNPVNVTGLSNLNTGLGSVAFGATNVDSQSFGF